MRVSFWQYQFHSLYMLFARAGKPCLPPRVVRRLLDNKHLVLGHGHDVLKGLELHGNPPQRVALVLRGLEDQARVEQYLIECLRSLHPGGRVHLPRLGKQSARVEAQGSRA